MDLFKCKHRIIFISLALTLLVALNYLVNTNYINISSIKSLVQKNTAKNENVALDMRKTTPRSNSLKETELNITKRPRKRRERPKSFYRTRDEVESTRTFNIQPELCSSNNTGISIFVISTANSLPRRDMLRSTWVKYARKKGICVYFLIGLDKNQHIQEEIDLEAKEHHDIIQGNFIEYYYNLTLKSISMLRWANTYCKQDHFIIKVDDDIIFQIDWFLQKKGEIKKGNKVATNIKQYFNKLKRFLIKEYTEQKDSWELRIGTQVIRIGYQPNIT